jgi:hypothetical protein
MESNITHICKYCNAETWQPDEQCYANPNNNTMENKKQTAVEWLQQGLETILTHKQQMQAIGLFVQAQEMFEEQMIDFAQEVFRNRYNQVHQSLNSISKETYNETYE